MEHSVKLGIIQSALQNLKVTDEKKSTLVPLVTATSALAIKYAGGVILAADTLGSYGSLARYKNCSRILKLSDQIALAVSGDYADFQFLKTCLEQMIIDEKLLDDGMHMSARHIFSWLSRVMYNRRSKFNPIWNSVIVAGFNPDGTQFLGCVDKLGTAWEAPSIVTGLGSHMIQPLFREFYERVGIENITEEMAKEFIETCLTVLYYRDCRTYDKYELAVCSLAGVKVTSDLYVKPNWDVAAYVTPGLVD